MYEIRSLREEDIQDFIQCKILVWNSLRGLLPAEMVEDEINKLENPEKRVEIRDCIEDPDRIILVAYEDVSIVGFASGRLVRKSLSWLIFLGVHPGRRRRGIGMSLVQKYMYESKVRGAEKISLYTPTVLKPASKLYENLGFIYEGVRERHVYGVNLLVYSRFLK
jgi:ribosomal protein S18 acetylase RimI-like enzyme